MKITQKKTPNQSSRNGHKPDMIVSHITEGGYNGAVSWLCNPKSGASSHYIVSKKGEITQLVSIDRMAWINGTSDNPTAPNSHRKSALKIVRDRNINANLYTVGIEHEGFTADGGGRLTPEQFKATVWLHKHIISEIKRIYGIDVPIDREHIVGHYQVDPIRKPGCPGKNFQWNDLIKALKEEDKLTIMWQGNPVKVNAINRNGNNYIMVRDLTKFGVKIDYNRITKEVIINGKTIKADMLLIKDFNYIKLQDLSKAGFTAGYDGKMPTIK